MVDVGLSKKEQIIIGFYETLIEVTEVLSKRKNFWFER